MRIDYSTKEITGGSLVLKQPYLYAKRHFGLATVKEVPLNLLTRIGHILWAILLCIPLFNIPVALMDRAIHQIPVIKITANTPFERGKQFGSALRSEIQDLYGVILYKITQDVNFIAERQRLVQHIPESLKEEMRGLAKGAHVKYEDVLNIHTFLDIRAGQYGCSVLATKKCGATLERLAATNHFEQERSGEFFEYSDTSQRQKKLTLHPLTDQIGSYKTAIKETGRYDTIQSILFDADDGSVHVANGWEKSCDNDWEKLACYPLNNQPDPARPSVKLVRNLDWPWKILGSETIVVCVDPGNGKPKFTNVTFPGYLGALSAMNDRRVVLACSQSGRNKQDGMPVTLLFRQVIEEAHSTADALRILSASKPASSMNLTIGGPDGLAKVELDPARAVTGYAHIVHGQC